jgi:hypothetical protein
MNSHDRYFAPARDPARLVLSGEYSPDGALQVVTAALRTASGEARTALVDATRARLNRPLTVIDCHYAGGCIARAGAGLAKVAFVVPGPCLAPLAFAFTVALNRGLRAASFSDEAQALEWLGG